jgi:hypothetical protein
LTRAMTKHEPAVAKWMGEEKHRGQALPTCN